MITRTFALAFAIALTGCASSELHEATSPTICTTLPDDARLAALYTSPIRVAPSERAANRRSLDVDRSRIEGAEVRLPKTDTPPIAVSSFRAA